MPGSLVRLKAKLKKKERKRRKERKKERKKEGGKKEGRKLTLQKQIPRTHGFSVPVSGFVPVSQPDARRNPKLKVDGESVSQATSS